MGAVERPTPPADQGPTKATRASRTQEQRAGIAASLTDIVAELANEPGQRERAWVLFHEAVDGGEGIAGKALTNVELVDSVRASAIALRAGQAGRQAGLQRFVPPSRDPGFSARTRASWSAAVDRDVVLKRTPGRVHGQRRPPGPLHAEPVRLSDKFAPTAAGAAPDRQGDEGGGLSSPCQTPLLGWQRLWRGG
ncbi:hypothetical protein D7X74_19490 [Corallococcus sp. CA047B]|nr:hypothetical protein D7X74_19490 [Corallococcus sp. CA047B]